MYISRQNELEDFIARNAQSRVLAIDTEFLREKTYRPKLCLLQLATENEVALVDPFEVEDLTVLSGLLSGEHVMKIVHAGSQDIEILYREAGVTPWPLFDTQVAAALLGYSQQVGYGALVQSECSVSLDKLDSFTDWSQRPLTASQLRYAADDVIYLPQLYRSMRDKLTRMGRLAWLEDDFRALADPARYEPHPRERYLHLKKGTQLNRRQLSAAREVAAWREERAVDLDIPRKWVLTDEQVVEACKRETRTIDQLFLVRGMREKLTTADARRVVSLIVAGLDAPSETWPDTSHKSRSERNVDCEVDLMTALVRKRARENDIAFQVLASHDSLQAIARGHYEGASLLTGWRYEMIGRELLDLMEGRLALSISHRKLNVARTDE